jgi:hypothetical protein
MRLLCESTLHEPERRASLLRGEVHLFSATQETRALCSAMRARLAEALPESDPKQAQHLLSSEELFTRIRHLRLWLAQGALREELRAVLAAFGCQPDTTYFDSLRLRAITSGGHQNPAAAPAYYPHRDVWFANPSCQLNWWLPLFEVRQEQGLGFYPTYWEKPIKNDSSCFDYDEFLSSGGWQAYGDGIKSQQHHSTIKEALTEAPVQLASAPDSLLLFAGAHLHASIPHNTSETRFSVEFRSLSLDDLRAGRGAPNLDNASRGSTLRDFLRLSDGLPFDEVPRR